MTTLHLEAREVKTAGEPISKDQLQENCIYFFVHFADPKGLIPMMQTVVFIGRNLEPGDEGTVYFQDVGSFRRGVRYSAATGDDEVLFQCGSENELGHVFDYEHALNVLLVCEARRKEAGIDGAIPAG